MTDQGNGENGGLKGSVRSILEERLRLEEERRKLDEMLKDKFQRNITVMFTDLKGSTAFFETYGDIEGRALVEQHNRIIFPIIAEHKGKVVKTMGDAIMATFDDPESAVKCAIQIQKALRDYNNSLDQKHKEIHVRIGLNYGPAVVEDNDVFGDAVNLAARVEGQCEPDQILISEDLYQMVKSSDEILCRLFGKVSMKGKSEQIKLYRVIFSEEHLVEEEAFKKSGIRKVGLREEEERVLELTFSREDSKLKVSVVEQARGEERTVQQYDFLKISQDEIEQGCEKVVEILNRANRRGKLSKELLKQLEEVGQRLYDQLLTREAKERLSVTKAEDLVIRIDDRLVQVPWELLYDGRQFLCQRFNVGRIVSTRQRVSEAPVRKIGKPLKMLILSDPRGDLAMSAKEGQKLRETLDRHSELIGANLKSSRIDKQYVMSKLRDYDIVHYAGHADYDKEHPERSGWLLSDGKLTAEEIRNLIGRKPMPALVFANGCQSGQTEEWKLGPDYEEQIFGLANAFLIAGVQHYIGTFWEILDEPGQEFALAFYQTLMEGISIGEAVRRAREYLIDKYGEDTIVWASYMLYGDPSFRYIVHKEKEEEKEEVKEKEVSVDSEAEQYARVTRGVSAQVMGKGISWKKVGIALVAFALLVIFGIWFGLRGVSISIPEDSVALAYQKLEQGKFDSAWSDFVKMSESRGELKARGFEGMAEVSFRRNDLSKAKEYASKALELDPDAVYPYVILGNIYYNQGDLESALKEYQAGISATNGKPWQKAEAYNRIGRIYSERDQGDKAVSYYQKAVELDSTNISASINLGQKLLKLGKPAQAETEFRRVISREPDNAMANLLLAEAVRAMKQAQEGEASQKALNDEINQLVERYKKNLVSMPSKQADEWTSMPLTLTFIDFTAKGKMALMEGEGDYLELAITNALKETGRVQVVEREKLDRLVQELNLSSSELASDDTRLRLGRLLSARLIATGSIVRYGGEIQVSLRLIETETSEVKVAITPKPFQEGASLAEIAKVIIDELVLNLKKAYPLRAKIADVSPKEVVISIGKKQGLREGIEFNVYEEQILTVGERKISRLNPIGRIKINRVDEELGYASILESTKSLQKGMKVEEI